MNELPVGSLGALPHTPHWYPLICMRPPLIFWSVAFVHLILHELLPKKKKKIQQRRLEPLNLS